VRSGPVESALDLRGRIAGNGCHAARFPSPVQSRMIDAGAVVVGECFDCAPFR
jgi:hypothetical protein